MALSSLVSSLSVLGFLPFRREAFMEAYLEERRMCTTM